jgi:sensor histidine kinase regulating citrate/malate metabolism
MLAMQLAIVCVVLVGVAAVSLAQSDARARDTEGRRALAIAERLAVTAGVREAAASGGENFLGQAQSVVESGRTFSSSTTVLLALRDRRVIASSDALPRAPLYLQATDAFDGRAWVGTEAGTGAAFAMAPIINVDNRETDGVVAVVRAYPSVLDNLAAAVPNLLTYLGIASLLGVVGSLLLARRVKRQTPVFGVYRAFWRSV